LQISGGKLNFTSPFSVYINNPWIQMTKRAIIVTTQQYLLTYNNDNQ